MEHCSFGYKFPTISQSFVPLLLPNVGGKCCDQINTCQCKKKKLWLIYSLINSPEVFHEESLSVARHQNEKYGFGLKAPFSEALVFVESFRESNPICFTMANLIPGTEIYGSSFPSFYENYPENYPVPTKTFYSVPIRCSASECHRKPFWSRKADT